MSQLRACGCDHERCKLRSRVETRKAEVNELNGTGSRFEGGLRNRHINQQLGEMASALRLRLGNCWNGCGIWMCAQRELYVVGSLCAGTRQVQEERE